MHVAVSKTYAAAAVSLLKPPCGCFRSGLKNPLGLLFQKWFKEIRWNFQAETGGVVIAIETRVMHVARGRGPFQVKPLMSIP
jgi:hypothetical protein